MDNNDKRSKNKFPDFTIGHAVDRLVDEEPKVIKVGSIMNRKTTPMIERRAFLKGTITTGASLAGLASTTGCGSGGNDSSGNDENDTYTTRADGQCENVFHPSHIGYVLAVAYDNTGSRLVSASSDGTAKVWDTSTGELLLTYQGHTNDVCCAAFSPDGTIIATGGVDHSIQIWDAASGNIINSFIAHNTQVNCLSFSLDGTFVVSGSMENTIQVRDVTTGALSVSYSGHTNNVYCLALSPDGKLVASGGDDKALHLWDVSTGQLIEQYSTADNVYVVCFSPDGTKVVSGGGDEVVEAEVWEVGTGSLLLKYSEHVDDGRINTLSFHSHGRVIASGGNAGPIHIWRTTDGHRTATLNDHHAATTSLAFSPDGTHIASGSWDQYVCIRNTNINSKLEHLLGDDSLTPITDPFNCYSGSKGESPVALCTTNTNCICNSVCTCDTVCTCESVCTCDSHSPQAPHYWYPN